MSVSCFLIETKFIHKLFKKFRWENETQEIPRLRLFMIFKNSSFPIIKISDLQSFKVSKIQRFKDSLDVEKIILFFINITFGSFMALSLHSWHSVRLMAHDQWGPAGPGPREGDRGAPSGHGSSFMSREPDRMPRMKR